ncbi:hypothetical protein Hanom_Chr01g00028421 [Helianthus anomalus]
MAELSAARACRRGAGRGRGQGRGQEEKEVDYDFEETAEFVCLVPRGTVAHGCLGRLREMELDVPRTIDIGFFDQHWIDRSGPGFMPTTSAWARLFEVGRERAHREITLEFLCTFVFTETRGRGLQHFLDTHAVSFTHCGASRTMTLPQFPVALGLYSADEALSQAFLDEPTTMSFDMLWPWWHTIGTGDFATPRSRSPEARVSRIYDPSHR